MFLNWCSTRMKKNISCMNRVSNKYDSESKKEKQVPIKMFGLVPLFHTCIHGPISLGKYFFLFNNWTIWTVGNWNVGTPYPRDLGKASELTASDRSGRPANRTYATAPTSIQRARVTLLKLRGDQSWESPRFLKESQECPFAALSPTHRSTSPEWHSG